jgi:hypothetical protein
MAGTDDGEPHDQGCAVVFKLRLVAVGGDPVSPASQNSPCFSAILEPITVLRTPK